MMKFRNDSKLVFNKKNHSYRFQGVKQESVTTFLKKFQPPFKRNYWSKKKAEEYGMTQKEVLDMWNKKALNSMEFGTKIHRYAELFSQYKIDGKKIQLETADSIPEMKYRLAVQKFWDDHYELTPIFVEKKLCIPAWRLAGTIDLGVECPEKKVYLVDWKTNEKIDMHNNFENMLSPLRHLTNCNFNQYSLQLSMYAYMLEKRYRYKIEGLYLIHLKKEDYKEYVCKYLKPEIEELIDDRLKKLGLKQNATT